MTTKRTVLNTVLTMPTPAIVDGRPVVPDNWAKLGATATLTQGPTGIHAIKDPDPVWDPRTSGWFTPPPAGGVGDARWTVRDLPAPGDFSGGWYWLGNRSSQDGTANIQEACRRWAPNGSTPSAPSWHSFFPFKPSVRSHDSYLPGGSVVHHPKGVHFNSYYIEHMWADFGRARRQPFTWVMAAMILHYSGRPQHLLDAGRNPDDVGFPRLSASAVNTGRTIADGLGYRSSLSVSAGVMELTSRAGSPGSSAVRERMDAGLRPRMFFGIFNGTSSYVGAYDTGSRRIRKGHTDNTGAQQHRYYVMGRKQNAINQDKASHMLVFESRFWGRALTAAELGHQYDQLSSTYHFDEYRAIR